MMSPLSSSSQSSVCTVFESLTLIPFRQHEEEECISEAVDTLWSLQYMVRGPICGSAGPILSTLLPESVAELKSNTIPLVSHCLHFRYGSEQNLQSFISHMKTKLMLKEKSEELTDIGIVTCTYSCQIPNELEAIFRRGSEWDEGFEVFLGVSRSQGTREEDVHEFLELYRQLACSSAFGAVQCAYGPVVQVMHHGSKQTEQADIIQHIACDIILLARFGTKEQMESFLQSPPSQAVLQRDQRSPVHAEWGIVMEISPTKSKEDTL